MSKKAWGGGWTAVGWPEDLDPAPALQPLPQLGCSQRWTPGKQAVWQKRPLGRTPPPPHSRSSVWAAPALSCSFSVHGIQRCHRCPPPPRRTCLMHLDGMRLGSRLDQTQVTWHKAFTSSCSCTAASHDSSLVSLYYLLSPSPAYATMNELPTVLPAVLLVGEFTRDLRGPIKASILTPASLPSCLTHPSAAPPHILLQSIPWLPVNKDARLWLHHEPSWPSPKQRLYHQSSSPGPALSPGPLHVPHAGHLP